MNKILKVTVTGFINEEFIGNDNQVEKYLLALKKRQDAEYSLEDLKWYKKEMPLFRNSFVQANSREYAYGSRYNELSTKYGIPDDKMITFREKYKNKGLKIKIEDYSNGKEACLLNK